MNKAVLQSIIDDLKAGRTPQLSSEDFPCFSAEALAGNNHVAPDYLDVIAKRPTSPRSSAPSAPSTRATWHGSASR